MAQLKTLRANKTFLLNISIYSMFLILSMCRQSTQQLESVAIKTEPFYIDLQHKFGSSSEFKDRGSILVKPKTDYRPAQASFVQQQNELTDSDLKALIEASSQGDVYYLRASVRKKKAGTNNSTSKIAQTILKACSLFVADLTDTLVINLNPLNEFVSLNLFTPDPECNGELPSMHSTQFNTTLVIDTGSLGPQPDTATYIKRLEEERQSKLKEGKEDNRSFLAKYWIYIVPAVIILMMMGGPDQGSR